VYLISTLLLGGGGGDECILWLIFAQQKTKFGFFSRLHLAGAAADAGLARLLPKAISHYQSLLLGLYQAFKERDDIFLGISWVIATI
jgi:hypothetical protein